MQRWPRFKFRGHPEKTLASLNSNLASKMADVDYENPGNAPGDDPEDDGVRRSGRKIKPATFADGTAVNQFIKSEF